MKNEEFRICGSGLGGWGVRDYNCPRARPSDSRRPCARVSILTIYAKNRNGHNAWVQNLVSVQKFVGPEIWLVSVCYSNSEVIICETEISPNCFYANRNLSILCNANVKWPLYLSTITHAFYTLHYKE